MGLAGRARSVANGARLLNATVATGIATIQYRSSTPLTMDPAALVASLHTLESDVGLRFTGPIHVVLCDQWSDFSKACIPRLCQRAKGCPGGTFRDVAKTRMEFIASGTTAVPRTGAVVGRAPKLLIYWYAR